MASLKGTTVTGSLTVSSDIIFSNTNSLQMNVDNSYIRVQGGSGEGNGSRLVLSGKSRSGYAGVAELVATNGTDFTQFMLYPNGGAKINSYDILHSNNISSYALPLSGGGVCFWSCFFHRYCRIMDRKFKTTYAI